jgi:DNA-binding beta-propeller fold protein YncE
VFETQPRLRFVARVALPGSPYGLAMDRERDRLWVTRTARNEVAEVDVAGRPRVLRTLPTVQQPNTVGVDPASGTLVIASATTGTVQLLRP